MKESDKDKRADVLSKMLKNQNANKKEQVRRLNSGSGVKKPFLKNK